MGDVNVPCTSYISIATLLRSLGSFTTLHVATLLLGWGGGVGDVNAPCRRKFRS